MNRKSLYLCPLVALLIFSLLPSMGAGEGTFSLVSAETGSGGVPLPLNHTVEVGSSTLYRARVINGLNRSVTATFVAAGLPEGATAVMTPSQATLGEGEELTVEILLTLTESLSYETGVTTFEIRALEGEEVLSVLPVTFVPIFQANFTAHWDNMEERTEVTGFTDQRLFVSLEVKNLATFRDDIVLDLVSAPSWADITFSDGEDSVILTLSPGEVRSVSLLLDLKEEGEGEVILRATSMASLYQREKLSVNLFLEIKAMGEIPLQTKLSQEEVWLEENIPVEISVEVRNPNPHPLSVYLTTTLEGDIEESYLEVSASPGEAVEVGPGEVTVWTLSVELTGSQSSGSWGIVKLRFWSQEGSLLGEGELKLYVNPTPQLDINTGPPPVLSPSGRGVINITLTNTGNCPLMGFFYADHVPAGLTVILPVRLLELPLDNWVSLRAEVIAAENITPGELQVTFLFNGYFRDSELLPFTENVTVKVNVVGEPRLHVGFASGRGYLLVNQSEVCSVEVFVTNSGTLTSSPCTLELYEVSRSFSRQLDTTEYLPPLSPGENRTYTFHITPSPSTVRIEVVVRSEECSASADLPVTIYTKPTLPKGSSAQGGISTGIAVGAAAASAMGGAALAMLFSRNEGVQLAFHKALIPLYSKLSPDEILNNKIRREIYQYIKSHPGEHFRSILLNLGLTNGTLAYHLYTLEKEELIKSRKDGLYRRFYPTGYKVEPVIPTNGMGQIYRLIVSEPGITQKEVSERLGIPSSSVNYSVKKLRRQGLIEIRREGRYTRLYPSHKGG